MLAALRTAASRATRLPNISWSVPSRCWLVDNKPTSGALVYTGKVTFIPNGAKGFAVVEEF